MTFAMQPEFMEGLTDAQQGACTAITSAFGAVTPAVLSSFSMALGPIAVANMIPAMYESTGNNVMSGMMTAANHAALGAATHVSQASYVAEDTPSGAAGTASTAQAAQVAGEAAPVGNNPPDVSNA